MPSKPIILAIYENDTNMKMAADLLSKEGYTIHSETNLFSAVASVVGKKIDIIIMDLDNLERKDMQFFDTVREVSPDVQILVTFSNHNREKATIAIEQGACSYILKPLSLSELHCIVKKLANPTELAHNVSEGDLQQPLERLATRIAHEVNNPLTTISGHLQVLMADAAEKHEDCRIYAIMEEEAQRIADIVKNLLTFAQPMESVQTLIDINSLLKGMLTPLSNDELSKGIVVIQDLQEDLPKVNANSKHLELSCKNIINSSKRAMRGKGTLKVSTRAQNSNLIQVSFRDTGPGIPTNILDRVFDPFYAVNNGGEETDLGLCVSYKIIKNHGGNLAVDSKKGKGTTFTITLPVINGSNSGDSCNVRTNENTCS